MSRVVICLIMGLVVVVVSAEGRASTTLTATLADANENPATVPTLSDGVTPRPASFGTVTFVLNDAQTSMTFVATVNNIDLTGTQSPDVNDDLTAAHIHAGAAWPPTNVGVVWGFFGSPFNDNNPNDQSVVPFATGVGGTISGKWDAPEGNGTTLAAQLTNILNGHSYINFHTHQFPGGEMRGTLTVTPEPASLALLGIGSLLTLRRRRGV